MKYSVDIRGIYLDRTALTLTSFMQDIIAYRITKKVNKYVKGVYTSSTRNGHQETTEQLLLNQFNPIANRLNSISQKR